MRLTPDEKATTIGHVDIWADPASGLALEVELYGVGEQRPVLTTTLLELKLGAPPTDNDPLRLPEGAQVSYEQSVDVAAAANAFAPYDLPASLAGLQSRNGAGPGCSRDLRPWPDYADRFTAARPGCRAAPATAPDRGTAQLTEVGTLAPVGPVGLLITPFRGRGGAFLLAGTVTADNTAAGSGRAAGAAMTGHAMTNGHVIRTQGLTKRYGEL